MEECSALVSTRFRVIVDGTALNLSFPRRRIRLFLRLAEMTSRPLSGVQSRSVLVVAPVVVALPP